MQPRSLLEGHKFREAVKRWGEPPTRRRVIVAPSMKGMLAREVNIADQKSSPVSNHMTTNSTKVLYNIDREIEEKRVENTKIRDWISERKAFRADLSNMGLRETWLNGKSERTACEERVLVNMKEGRRRKKIKSDERSAKTASPSSQVDYLPLLTTPLPIALAVIADYLQQKRLRLIDLFVDMDKDKNWNASKEEMKLALLATGIPLSDEQLEELILALDVDNDDELSYKELARGIETYHKDRRWQKLKRLYDQIADEPTEDDKLSDFSAMVENYQKAAEEMHELELDDLFPDDSVENIINEEMHDPEGGDAEKREKRMSYHQRCSNALDTVQLASIKLPDIDDNTDLMTNQLRNRQRQARRQHLIEKQREKKEREARKQEDARMHIPDPKTTLTGVVASSKIQYINFIEKECERCLERIQKEGVFQINPDHVKHVLIPPKERSTRLNIKSLSHERSIYPALHDMNADARRRQQLRMRDRGAGGTRAAGGGESVSTAKEEKVVKGVPLPRVASIDTRLAQEGRRQRREQANAMPSPCWPQHLLDKLYIYLDEDPSTNSNGKSSTLFHKIQPGR